MAKALGRWVAGAAVMGILVAHAVAAQATPVTISDPYVGSGSGTPDVIGDPAYFDIRQIVLTNLTSSRITAELYFNSYKDPKTGAYSYFGYALAPGDLLFDVGGQYKYGIALYNHGGLTAGDVYQVASTYVASQLVVPNPGDEHYRPDRVVQVNAVTSSSPNSTGTVSSVLLPGGSGTEYKVTLDFAPSAQFWADVLNTPGGLGVHFAAATCGNDVIDGHIPTPEPGTLLLLGGGLVAVGAAAKRRVVKTA